MTRPPPRTQIQRMALAAIALMLAGCAAPTPKTWQVAPNYRIAHAGPGADQGYVALARQYKAERRWREAWQAWQKAALEAPDDPDILNELALAEAGQGRYAHAVRALRHATTRAPKRAALFNNLGYALLLDGQHEAAKTALQQALNHNPAHRLARANLTHLAQADSSSGSPQASTTVTADTPTLSTATPGRAPRVQTAPDVAALQTRQTDLTEAPQTSQAPQRQAVQAGVAVVPRVEIANGNGVTGMAAWLRDWLHAQGALLSNVRPFDTPTTVVHYRTGYDAVARDIAQRMPHPIAVASAPGETRQADIRIVLGKDLRARH